MYRLIVLQCKGMHPTIFSRPLKFCLIFVLIVLIGCGVRSTRPKDANKRLCNRQMRDINIAVQQYLNENGDFPLVSTSKDAVKERNHCWTSYILPNMYETRHCGPYRFYESWDSAENARLGDTLHVFTCSADPGLKNRERSYFLLGELNPDITDRDERYKLVEIHSSGVLRLSPVPSSLQAELLSKIGSVTHRNEK